MSPFFTVRSARKDGRDVVVMRCRDNPPDCIVECDVYPATNGHSGRFSCGPYTFASRDEAEGFVDEALRALASLGCDVS